MLLLSLVINIVLAIYINKSLLWILSFCLHVQSRNQYFCVGNMCIVHFYGENFSESALRYFYGRLKYNVF